MTSAECASASVASSPEGRRSEYGPVSDARLLPERVFRLPCPASLHLATRGQIELVWRGWTAVAGSRDCSSDRQAYIAVDALSVETVE